MQPSWLAHALNVGVVDGLCFGETISDTSVSEKTKFYFLVVFQHWEICTAFLLSKSSSSLRRAAISVNSECVSAVCARIRSRRWTASGQTATEDAAQLTYSAASPSCLSGQTMRLLFDRWGERAAGSKHQTGSWTQMKATGQTIASV